MDLKRPIFVGIMGALLAGGANADAIKIVTQDYVDTQNAEIKRVIGDTSQLGGKSLVAAIQDTDSADVALLNTEINNIKNTLADNGDRIDAVATDVDGVKSTLATASTNAADALNVANAASDKVGNLSELSAGITNTNVVAAINSVAAQNTDNSATSEKINALESQVIENTAAIAARAKSADLDTLAGRVTTTESNIASVDEELDLLNTTVSTHNEKINALGGLATKTFVTTDEITNKTIKLEDLSDEVTTKLGATDTEVGTLSTKLSNLESAVASNKLEYTSGIAANTAEIDELQSAVATSASVDDVNAVANNLSAHVADAVVHITADERAKWNTKQDALTPGQLAVLESGVTAETIQGLNNTIGQKADTSALNALTGVVNGLSETVAANKAAADASVAQNATAAQNAADAATAANNTANANKAALENVYTKTQTDERIASEIAKIDGAASVTELESRVAKNESDIAELSGKITVTVPDPTGVNGCVASSDPDISSQCVLAYDIETGTMKWRNVTSPVGQ